MLTKEQSHKLLELIDEYADACEVEALNWAKPWGEQDKLTLRAETRKQLEDYISELEGQSC